MNSFPFLHCASGLQTRWASPENPTGEPGQGGRTNGGRKGRPSCSVAAGETVTLALAPPGSSGMVRRIWLTVDDRSPEMLRSLVLSGFWDACDTPALCAPLGDFFGVGLGLCTPFQSALFSSPEGRSFNSVVPMPFRDGMRLTLTNESARDLPFLFYDVNYTLGDTHGPDSLYLHTYFHRENPTHLQTDYTLVPEIEAYGRYLGANIGVRGDREQYGPNWWGEGEVKIYLDGDTDYPTLCGTGTEDYVGTAWGQGQFNHLYQGSPVYESGQYCFYRLHIPDPVYFQSALRVTLGQIGGALGDGKQWLRAREAQTGEPFYAAAPALTALNLAGDNFTLFERQDDVSSCAYLYLGCPAQILPPLPQLVRRLP